MKRDYPEMPIVGVGAVIIDGTRVVVIRRGSEPLKGEWSIPGGVLELGEKLREAAAREAYEETGLIVEAGEVLDVFDAVYLDQGGNTEYHYVLIDFMCKAVGGQLHPGSDAAAARWVRPDELDRLNMTPNTLQVIRKALAKVNAH